MKLSANAKEFVKADIKAAFEDDLKKANEAVSAAKKAADEKFAKFQTACDALKADMASKVAALVKKHGLVLKHVTGDKVPEFSVDHVSVGVNGPYYGDVSSDCSSIFTLGPAFVEASRRIEKIKGDIEKAVSTALFEIEVHGKKDTVEQIVSDVIREIREGK